MNKVFERVILTIASLVVIAAFVGLYISFTSSTSSFSTADREVVGQLASVENNVKRKVFGNFAWDVMGSGEPVFFKDVIFVSPKSSMTLKLADDTELQVGENTLLVLDNKLFDDNGARMEVTELRLIRGQVSVKQNETSLASTTTSTKAPRPIQVVLNEKVKVDLKNKAAVSLSKQNNKASIVFDKGDVALSLGGKNKQSKNVKLAYNKPTLINEIDLSPEGRPELEELKTEELKAEDVQDPKKPFASLPVIKADSGTSIVAEGDLSGLDSVVPQRKFAPRNKGSVAEVLTDDDFLLAKPEATPRGVAAIATPEPSPVPQPVTELPPKILPIATPEPKKARLPIQPVAPEDSTLVDYQRDIKPLTFSWESTVPNVHFYMLELSPEKKFTNILTRIAVDSAEGKTIRDQDGKRMQFELKVSPVYILYVPGLLGSVYKNKEIYWRVVPLDRDNNPVLRTKFLEMRRIGFKTSKTAEIIARDSLVYTKENLFTAAPSLSLQWSLKNAVPGSYQLVIASDPDFKAQICTKDVSKYSFKKGVSLRQQPEISGQQSRLDLTFNEDVKIDIRGECPLENLMKAKKPIYYKIITFDPAEQKLPYSNGKSATGKFEFKE